MADTVKKSVNSFNKGIPVGDSAGPMVAYNIFSQRGGVVYYDDVKDTVVAECDYEVMW